MSSNEYLTHFDVDHQAMRYIAQSHLFQSWNRSNLVGYMENSGTIDSHLTTLTIKPGCVGIGTVPTKVLDVNGDVLIRGNLDINALSVSNTALVSNFNADLLDGLDGSAYRNATNINTGTLAVSYGGTGATSLTASKVLVGNGTSAVSAPSTLHWNGANIGVGTAIVNDRVHVYEGGILVENSFAGPIKVVTANNTSSAPYLYALGRRVDSNQSYSFCGKLALAKHYTAGSLPSGHVIGIVAFGGNHTNGAESNVQFAASLTGVNEEPYGTNSNMSTALVFRTGNLGKGMTDANTAIGNERMRISGAGNIGIGSTTPISALDVIGSVRASSQLVSSVATGTAPLSVASTTVVTNLNADLLDGLDGTYYRSASNINAGGVLAVSYGGTGVATLTANKLLVGNGTGSVVSPTSLHWDAVNSRLGLGGITAPETPLHTKGFFKLEGNHIYAPDIYFISEYEPNAGQWWWKVATIQLTNNNLFEMEGNFSRVDNSTSLTFSLIGHNNPAASNYQIYSENIRQASTPQSAVEVYRDTSSNPNNADIYLRVTDYCWATMKCITHATVNPVSWSNAAPTTSSNYYKIYDTSVASNNTLIKTHGVAVGIGTFPRTGISLDCAGTIGATGGFIGNAAGLSNFNLANIGVGSLTVPYGGTGCNVLTSNKLLVGNGSNPVYTPTDLHWDSNVAGLGIGTTALTERLTVAGNVVPSACNLYDLGTSALRWRNLQVSCNIATTSLTCHLTGGTPIYGIYAKTSNVPAQDVVIDTNPLLMQFTHPFPASSSNLLVHAQLQQLYLGGFTDSGMYASLGRTDQTGYVEVYICREKNYNGSGNPKNAWGTIDSRVQVTIMSLTR